ncbi:hypothetical protein HGRIS_001349 [Hohenbuehelia grisea]|uniref:Uncharacterized protein n=1 Tax=Hohenbuehelia grisea TaxID=104357 RepID=A0ABR3JPM9_9AGAR
MRPTEDTCERENTECVLYEDHRPLLREISRDIVPPEILDTPKRVNALIEFLRLSGAYSRAGFIRNPRAAPKFEEETDVPEDDDDEIGEG